MKQQVKNFTKFYVLLKQMPGLNEQLKESLVWQFSGLRTNSLREMTKGEYNTMIRYMQEQIEQNQDEERVIKKLRSGILTRLQKHGIDTTNWNDVNRFMQQPRIAGKALYELSIPEMQNLIGKIESILAKDKIQQQNINRLMALN